MRRNHLRDTYLEEAEQAAHKAREKEKLYYKERLARKLIASYIEEHRNILSEHIANEMTDMLGEEIKKHKVDGLIFEITREITTDFRITGKKMI